jgi:hypothetical protein
MPDPSDADVAAIAQTVEAGTDAIAVPEEMLVEPPAAPVAPAEPPRPAGSLYAQIVTMSVHEKIKLALRGNKDARSILIRDSNKLIRRLVLQNPRFTDVEAAAVGRNRSADEEALRVISERREWMRNYQVRLALATNPKTPIPTALKLLPTLGERDVRQLAKSKNVPEHVAAQCRRMLFAKQPGGG